MFESYPKLFELCISMVTALISLAYPLSIGQIDKMREKYKSRYVTQKFKKESLFIFFNILIVICIVELFIFPVIIKAFDTEYINLMLISIQGICVFMLSINTLRLLYLIIIYSDPFLYFNRTRVNETGKDLFDNLLILIQYASKNKTNADLFNDSMREFIRMIVEFQQGQLSNNEK